jgi:hypothetical protein
MRRRSVDELHRDGARWKGTVAGLLGGLAGAWAMNEFQAAWSAASEAMSAREENQQAPAQPPSHESESGDATVRAAAVLSHRLLGHVLTQDERTIAGPIVHFMFGATMGALYGALAEVEPAASRGYGVAFGTVVWLGADEVAVPAFGLSKPPTAYPASVHAYALTSHLVYGMTTDLVRRALRAAL